MNYVTRDCHKDLNVKLKITVRNADQFVLNNNQADSKGLSPKSNESELIRIFTRPSLVDPVDD